MARWSRAGPLPRRRPARFGVEMTLNDEALLDEIAAFNRDRATAGQDGDSAAAIRLGDGPSVWKTS